MLQWLRKSFRRTTGKEIDSNNRWEHLESILGFSVGDNKTHFERALRHRSIIDGDRYESHETYERLEFLGDAVLDLIVTEIIFEQFPTKDEGFLTKLRAKLVRGDTLADLAFKLKLNSILEIGERAQGQGIEFSRSVMADIFESLVAAVYLTLGYQSAYVFVEGVILEHIQLEELVKKVDNFKSLLLEFTQANKLSLPHYNVISEEGPGHDKTFTVEVIVDGKSMGSGTGKSKKTAEQAAARKAIHSLNAEYS